MASPYDWSPESVQSSRRFGTGLMQQGADYSPVGHWTQGIARALQGGVGGYMVGQANEGERAGKESVANAYREGIANNLPMKQIAARLMGNPFGQEQGQQMAGRALETEQAQGFQREQQDRGFSQQLKLQQGSQAHSERMARLSNQLQIEGAGKQAAERYAIGQRYGLQGDDLNTYAVTGQTTLKGNTFELKDGERRFQQIKNPDGTIGAREIAGSPKGLDSTSKKAVFEAQDELPNLKSAVDQLNEAKALLPSIYTGYGAQLRSTFNQAMPAGIPNVLTDPEKAKATQRYNQILSGESISAMSQTLKGATTDREMFEFQRIMNDPNQSADTKVKMLDYMIRKAQAHYDNKVARIREFGGRMPQDGAAAPPAATPQAQPQPPTAAPRQRAVNPKTGEAVEFDGTSWVPVR